MSTYGYQDLETFFSKFLKELTFSDKVPVFGAVWHASNRRTQVAVVGIDGDKLEYRYVNPKTRRMDPGARIWGIKTPLSIISIRMEMFPSRGIYPVLTILDTDLLIEEVELGKLRDRSKSIYS